jgi:hypothetical protein
MKNASEVGLGAMMYEQRFIKIGSRIEKLLKGDTQVDTQTAR